MHHVVTNFHHSAIISEICVSFMMTCEIFIVKGFASLCSVEEAIRIRLWFIIIIRDQYNTKLLCLIYTLWLKCRLIPGNGKIFILHSISLKLRHLCFILLHLSSSEEIWCFLSIFNDFDYRNGARSDQIVPFEYFTMSKSCSEYLIYLVGKRIER